MKNFLQLQLQHLRHITFRLYFHTWLDEKIENYVYAGTFLFLFCVPFFHTILPKKHLSLFLLRHNHSFYIQREGEKKDILSCWCGWKVFLMGLNSFNGICGLVSAFWFFDGLFNLTLAELECNLTLAPLEFNLTYFIATWIQLDLVFS